MGHHVYYFGDYALDPASRKLRLGGDAIALPPKSFDCLVYLIENRERAIGRDELISAVWGRVDASDAVVSQTLLRARRAVGDTGSEQSAVRTVTRFGYQWVAPVVCVPHEAPKPVPATTVPDNRPPDPDARALASATGAPVSMDIAGAGVGTPPAAQGAERAAEFALSSDGARDLDHVRARPWRWIAAAVVVLIVFAVLSMGRWRQNQTPVPARLADLVIVLPVVVQSPGAQHAWIRLGAMDYIASLLRRNGRLSVLPSERTLALVDPQRAATPDAIDRLRAITRARWVLQPVATEGPQGWRLRIRVSAPGKDFDIEARGGSPLDASATASSALLHRLGRDGPASPAPTALTQRVQQVDAELLAGQMDAARALIEAAPPSQRQDPPLQVREGQLQFRMGNLNAAQALFGRIVDAKMTLAPDVRSQALMGLGAVALRRSDNTASERRYDQAVGILEAEPGAVFDPALLGNAYNGRGVARAELGRIDEAIADLGRARIAMQRSGDEVEAAAVGGNIGTVKANHGDAAQAVQEFDLSIATFERFDVRDNLVVMLLAKSDAQLQLLQPAAALEDSQRAMELGRTLENPQLRAFMSSTRIKALLDSGRLQEADRLLRQDKAAPAGLRLRMLLERGRGQAAYQLAQVAPKGATENDEHLVLVAVQAAIAGKDIALARQWLQPNPDRKAFNRGGEIELANALLLAADGDQARAVREFDAAMKAAARTSAPADDARNGAALAIYLVAQGKLDRASEVMGGLTAFVDRDYRVARAALLLYRALGDLELQAQGLARVRKLAGERNPDSAVVY